MHLYNYTGGESHCLIIGDPGLGKSQLLKYCAKVSQRAVHTTGIGTTSAGLTVTAQRDSGQCQSNLTLVLRERALH